MLHVADVMTRVEYERLVGQGFFGDDRVELLEGRTQTIDALPPPHADALTILTRDFVVALHDRAGVRVRAALAASDFSEPEPDLSVVPRGRYRGAHPREAHLVVEISRASFVRNSATKARIYAKAGVPEYWVVDVEAETVAVHTRPRDGGYDDKKTYAKGDHVAPAHFPDISIALDDLFADECPR